MSGAGFVPEVLVGWRDLNVVFGEDCVLAERDVDASERVTARALGVHRCRP